MSREENWFEMKKQAGSNQGKQDGKNLKIQNKCSVGPETSRPEVEKLAARVSFPREKVFIPRSDSLNQTPVYLNGCSFQTGNCQGGEF